VKILFVSLILWIFVLPCAVAICLILMFLAGLEPDFYLVFTALVVTFATFAIGRALPWTRQSFKESSGLSSTSHQESTSFQEKHHEKCLEGQLHP
jgi:hypothetical protein